MIIVKAKNGVQFFNESVVARMEFPQVKNKSKKLLITMTNGTIESINHVEEIICSEGQQQVRIGADGRETTNDHLMETFEKVKKELNLMKDNNNNNIGIDHNV